MEDLLLSDFQKTLSQLYGLIRDTGGLYMFYITVLFCFGICIVGPLVIRIMDKTGSMAPCLAVVIVYVAIPILAVYYSPYNKLSDLYLKLGDSVSVKTEKYEQGIPRCRKTVVSDVNFISDLLPADYYYIDGLDTAEYIENNADKQSMKCTKYYIEVSQEGQEVLKEIEKCINSSIILKCEILYANFAECSLEYINTLKEQFKHEVLEINSIEYATSEDAIPYSFNETYYTSKTIPANNYNGLRIDLENGETFLLDDSCMEIALIHDFEDCIEVEYSGPRKQGIDSSKEFKGFYYTPTKVTIHVSK